MVSVHADNVVDVAGCVLLDQLLYLCVRCRDDDIDFDDDIEIDDDRVVDSDARNLWEGHVIIMLMM